MKRMTRKYAINKFVNIGGVTYENLRNKAGSYTREKFYKAVAILTDKSKHKVGWNTSKEWSTGAEKGDYVDGEERVIDQGKDGWMTSLESLVRWV